MAFDYSKLREKIKNQLGSEEEFARQMGLCKASVSFKLNGKTRFSQDEIPKICKLLEIPDEEIASYFFK